MDLIAARVAPFFQQIAPFTDGVGQEGEAEIFRIGQEFPSAAVYLQPGHQPRIQRSHP